MTPLTKDKITSKSASARNKRPAKSTVKPISDEEFDLLIKNLRKPIPTSTGDKHKKVATTPMTKSLRDEHIYANVILPKNDKNTTHIISMTSDNEYLAINHMYDGIGKRQSIDKLLKNNPDIWSVALSNESGRLAQGIRDIKGNNVLDFISHSEVPADWIATYANMVCDIRPLKTEKFRVRLTVGGDRLQYPDNTVSPVATLLETKLLLNSTISQSAKGARFMTLDIKDFFLQTIMERPEYMKIHAKCFPKDIRDKYNIKNKIHSDGYVYCMIKRGMYGLKQAARLAYDNLKLHIGKYGYYPDKVATNIWSHQDRRTKFCLYVDDFGVQYFCKEDADHLIKVLQEKYIVTTDFTGQFFCGLDIIWNYTDEWVDIFMNNFVSKTLTKLLHKPPTRKRNAPHQWQLPRYGQNR